MTDLTAEQWQAIADGHKKVNFKHYAMLQEILGMATLAHDYETEDQLRLLLTQIEVKLMDYGIHLPRSRGEAEQAPPTPETYPQPTGRTIVCDKCDGTGKLDEVEWVKT